MIDSNEVIGNYQSGIAIDRGFNNQISHNLIQDNPIGIELWEGSPVLGYSTFHSQDYPIFNNMFDGNTRAISAANTKHAIQILPPCDMAEPVSMWYAYPEVGYPAKVKIPDSVYFDSTEKKVGAASVKLVTSRGYDLALYCRPAGDSLSRWTLSDLDTLFFWVRTIKQPQYGFQFFSVRVGDDHGNFYKYTASPTLLNAANLVWKQYKFPLSGNSQFSRSVVGAMSLDKVNYVEIHADTWDYGFTLWVDGLQFEPCSPITGIEDCPIGDGNSLMNYPNPFSGTTTIMYSVKAAGQVKLEVYDSHGALIATLQNRYLDAGDHEIEWNSNVCHGIENGLFLLKLTTVKGITVRKIILLRK